MWPMGILFEKKSKCITVKKKNHRLIQAGCSSGNIEIVEEAAAVLQFCLHNKQDEGITLLDDKYNRKYLVVECKGL